MKKFGMAAFMALSTFNSFVLAQDDEADEEETIKVKEQCLFCRNEDIKAGFLVSFSYCDQQELCLKDAWNYISRNCATKWKRGKNMSLSACDP